MTIPVRKFEAELTPVDDVREIRKRLSHEAGDDVRQLARRSAHDFDALRAKLKLKLKEQDNTK